MNVPWCGRNSGVRTLASLFTSALKLPSKRETRVGEDDVEPKAGVED